MGGITMVRRCGVVALLCCGLAGVSAASAHADVSITGGSGPEGSGTNSTATFTVHSTTAAPVGGIEVAFALQSAGSGAATATSGQDFLPPSGNHVTIASGEQDATIEVAVVGDSTDEEDQVFAVRLTSITSGGASIDGAHDLAQWTIQDDDAPPTVSIADGYEGTSASSPLPEGTGSVRQMTFEVTLSAPSEKIVKVDYDAIPGTAAAQVTPGDTGDYQPPTAGHAPLTINAGTTTGKIFISIIADSRDEADETFSVKLSNPQNVTLARDTAVGKIVDDDGPTANILDATVTEGPSGQSTGVDVTVVLDQASVQDVSFAVTTGDDTAKAPDDYDAIATAQTLTISAGRLTGSVRVTVRGDDVDEGDEAFKVKLTLTDTSNASLGDGTASVTIKDDDPAPALSVSSPSVAEGTGNSTSASVTISLAVPAARKLKVGYATKDGSAVAGVDYQATNATVDFDIGQTSQTVTIPIAGDSVLEPDETFVVRAFHTTTDTTNQTVQDNSVPEAAGVVTIVDDDLDADNTPTLTAGTARADEGDSGARAVTFTVRLDAASPRTVSASYRTANGSAKAGQDYVATSGRITIPAGAKTATLTVEVLGDTKPEDNEDFKIVLADVANARAATGGGLGVIIDDDAGGGPITVAAGIKRIAIGRLVCRTGRSCKGLPVTWNVAQRGTISIDVRGLSRKVVTTTTGTGKARKTVRRTVLRRTTLFHQTVTVKPGRGSTQVRVRAKRTVARVLARLRTRKIKDIEVRATFTNRRGAQQAPTTVVLSLR